MKRTPFFEKDYPEMTNLDHQILSNQSHIFHRINELNTKIDELSSKMDQLIKYVTKNKDEK
jgi:hypothetical protein